MKYLFLFCMLSLVFGCKKDSYLSDYEKSFDSWVRFKDSSKNSYKYIVTTSSWIGISDSSTITVIHGTVSGRQYKQYSTASGTGVKTLIKSWVETSQTLNSHQEGATAITLDQVYIKAKNDWLNVKKDNNHIYFEAKNNGMISLAGHVPNNCADDCFVGIRIVNISPAAGLD